MRHQKTIHFGTRAPEARQDAEAKARLARDAGEKAYETKKLAADLDSIAKDAL